MGKELKMDNNLDELNKVLYEQLETLHKTPYNDSKFKEVRDKANAISNMGNTIIKSTELQLKASIFAKSFKAPDGAVPKMIEDGEN